VKCYALMRNVKQPAGVSKQAICQKYLTNSEWKSDPMQNFVQFWAAFKYKHGSNEESPEHRYNSYQKKVCKYKAG